MSACLLTVYQGGTTTLAATYQDIGLTIPAQNPLVGDASGRVPLFFVADGSYALRLTDQFGIQSNGGYFYPQIPSIGASSSGGGGSVVDPTTVFSTGDTKWRLEESTISGWIRINGRTIGNAGSGASERANADTQALFIYIWSTFADAICPVVGGRGSSALADFNAGKQITLLDARASTIFGLDDMGNAASGAFTGVPFSAGNATTGGSSAGTNATNLTLAELPTGIASASNGNWNVGGATNGNLFFETSNSQTNVFSAAPGVQVFEAMSNGAVTLSQAAVTSGTTISNNTSGQAFPMVPSALLGTLFWKL